MTSEPLFTIEQLQVCSDARVPSGTILITSGIRPHLFAVHGEYSRELTGDDLSLAQRTKLAPLLQELKNK